MPTLAIVGGSHIHTPNFAKKLAETPGVTTKLVWEPDEAMARERAEVTGATIVASPDDVWNDSEVDAVVICSETSRHEELVLGAVRVKKHLFVEKPLGMGAADAYRMADAIEDAGLIFQTGYFMRGSATHQFLKTAIANQAFGPLTRLRLSNCHNGVTGRWLEPWAWMLDPKHAGCGALGDLGTHVLDILLWIMQGDEVVAVTGALGTATGRHDDVDEFGEAMIRFRSGAVATLAGSWDDAANPHSLFISGLEGFAAVTEGKLKVKSENVPGDDAGLPRDMPEAWPHAFDLFLKAVAGETGIPLVTPREAAWRSAVMEAIYTGARESRWVEPSRPA